MPDTLSIIDNRTGKRYEVPVKDGTIRAMDLRQIKVADDDFGLMTYDPAFTNTASCRSAITYIDGDVGVLEYRGYPIEQLAEKSTYLEVAYLLLFGELPTTAQLNGWQENITTHTMLHENIKHLMRGFRYDAHPMGVFLSTVGALSTFYTDAKQRRRRRGAAAAVRAADRQDADRSPPTPTATRPAASTSIRTTSSPSPATS